MLCNGDDRCLRQEQGGAVGAAACWVRVRLRHEADTGSRNPNIFSGNFIFMITEEQRLRPLLFCFFTGGGVMKTPCCPLHLFP